VRPVLDDFAGSLMVLEKRPVWGAMLLIGSRHIYIVLVKALQLQFDVAKVSD
jgi:hypothetical protein